MHTARRLVLPLSVVCALAACGGRGPVGAPEAARGDALFLAEAPPIVPDEIEPDLDAMGIRRLYVPGATLSASGAIAPVNPPPPNPIRRPVIFTVVAEPGAEALLAPGAKGEVVGEAWGSALGKIVADARSWAQVAGVHIHMLPRAESAETLAAALKALKRSLGGNLPVSVTLRSDAPAAAWKPLVGVADEALVFVYGRRPETGDSFVKPLSAEAAREFPIPFRTLFVVGGYGRAGADEQGRRIADGEIDRLSEDHGLDFQFSGVLSADPGAVVTFRPRAEVPASRTLLGADGGGATFRYLTAVDLSQSLGEVGRWSSSNLKGRVFLVDGVPKDGHLVGYPALRAMLTGKPWQPKLAVDVVARAASPGGVEFTLEVTNEGPTACDLSHMNGYVEVRAKGGVFTNVKSGDFDRFEILVPEDDAYRPAPFGRATVCRLFENVFVAGEKNEAGPIRVAGARPEILVGYSLTLPGGGQVNAAPAPVTVTLPTPAPAPKRRKK